MAIEGKLSAPGSAAQTPATLHLHGEQFEVSAEDGRSLTGRLDRVVVSDRVGNVLRKLTLPDGSAFFTKDNDAIDGAFVRSGKIAALIHALEAHMGAVIVASILTVVLGFSFFKWGVPWASAKIAHALPPQTNAFIAGNTLSFLDKHVFKPTKLDQERIETITEQFYTRVVPLETNSTTLEFTLHFRDWSHEDIDIPNALALPSGDIILTDEFVRLSQSQEEIDAVLLHEMGHVVHRHTLEMVIEATFITTAVTLIVGDASGIADLGAGLGSILISTNYSRNHETEADQYAFEHMLEARMDPDAFSRIMRRLTNTEENESDAKGPGDASIGGSSKDSIIDYLSTHPSTDARIQQANRYRQCYQQGLLVCDQAILDAR